MGTSGDNTEELISEPITPEKGSFDPAMMATGLASLPAAFIWRNRRYQIIECLEHAKQSSPEGWVEGKEQYLRRQVFTVRLDSGEIATLYFERQGQRGASRRSAPGSGGGGRGGGEAGAATKQRWFLYSIRRGD